MYWKSIILIAGTNEDGETARSCNVLKWLKNDYEPDPQKSRCMDVTHVDRAEKHTMCLCDTNMCNKSSSLKGGLVGTFIFALFMVL